jgi:hypothetical protein
VEQLEVIKWLIGKLEEAKIKYFITGSIASTYYGIPRFTHDIDIVITIRKERADDIVRLFSDDGYISKESILEAFDSAGMFNFIHHRTGMKADFWIHKDDPFGQSCFDRSKKVELSEGFSAVLASPEDVVLHKVYWSKLTLSERQIRDARGIIAVQTSGLDLSYIKKWAGKLDIETEIEALFDDKDLPNLT